MPAAAKPRSAARPATRKKVVKRRARRKPNPFLAWRKRLDRTRPGLIRFTQDALATLYGHPAWERRFDPTSELILTILTQNSADVNAEHAFQALREAYPSDRPSERHMPGPGWRRPCARSTRRAGTTPSSSSATCPRSRRERG
jgi:hypothetical protein